MEGEVYAYAEIGGEHHADFFAGGFDGGFARVVEAGGADDDVRAAFHAFLQVAQGGFGAGEVDEHVALGDNGVRVVGNGDAGFQADGKACVEAECVGAGMLDCAAQYGVGVFFNGFDQNAPHAAVCAGDSDFQGIHAGVPYGLLRLRGGLELPAGVFDGVAFGFDHAVILKPNGKIARFGLVDNAVAAGFVGIIPAVLPEGGTQKRRAQQQLHLVAAHAGLQGGHGAGVEAVALDDFQFIGRKMGNPLGRTGGEGEKSRCGKQTGGFVHGFYLYEKYGKMGETERRGLYLKIFIK